MWLGGIMVRTSDLNNMLTSSAPYLYFYLYLWEDRVPSGAEAIVSFCAQCATLR